jgi:S1-C subfamily serine protease
MNGFQAGQHPAPVPPVRRRGRLPALMAAMALVVLVAIGGMAWGLGRSQVTGIPLAQPVTPPASQPAEAQSVADRVASGLVDVNTVLAYQGAEAAGTGIVLTAGGEVLTNNHVVQGATEITVTDIGNGRTYPATVVGYDRSHDIAVLHLQGASGLATATIGDSDRVAVGDAVLGIGNAGGAGGAPSVAPGTVTALDQTITAADQSGANAQQLSGLIQVDATIQPGDSGGPLVNATGQVVGVDTAASTSGDHLNRRGGTAGGQAAATVGFAIPINDALAIADEIESGAGSSTVHIGQSAMLGVSAGDTGQGAVVGQVLSGGPAAKVGLAAGDVITSVDGRAVGAAADLTGTLDQHHPGDTVTVTWLDQAQRQHTGKVALAAGPVG